MDNIVQIANHYLELLGYYVSLLYPFSFSFIDFVIVFLMQLPEPFSFIFTWFAAVPLIVWLSQSFTNAIVKDFLILKVESAMFFFPPNPLISRLLSLSIYLISKVTY